MSLDLYGSYIAALGGKAEPGAGSFDGPYGDYLSSLQQTAPQQQPTATPEPVAPAQASERREPPGPSVYDMAVVGGKVVLPEFGVLEADIYTRGGKVAAIHQGARLPAAQVVNARGKHVLPGIIDPHIHLGIADTIDSELQTESVSAVLGGVTTAGVFIGADLATMGHFEGIAESVQSHSHINILPHFVVATREQIAQIPHVVRLLGVRSFKAYLHGVPGLIASQDDGFILDVMQALKSTGERCVLCIHTENHALVTRATEQVRASTGAAATLQDWAETHPEMAEEEAVMRMAYFAKKMQQTVYLVHMSTKGAVERLAEIRKDNPYVIAETTSPYLSINTDHYTGGFAAKMEPPVRAGRHVDALWKAVVDGTIDTIGTDNVSWNVGQKNFSDVVWEVNSGYPAMGTHLPSVLTEGYLTRGIDLASLVGKMTMGPAKAFDLYPAKGTLLPGSDADIAIVDLESVKKVEANNLRSRSEFSIYEGRSFTGWPVMTIQGGRIVAADGEIVDRPRGRLIV